MEKSYIELFRTSQYVNSLRNYEIYIDGNLSAKMPNGSEKTIEVPSGKHNIFVKIDWCKSQIIDLDLKPGEKKKFICGSKVIGSKKWFATFYVFSKNKWVFLEPFSKELSIEYQDINWNASLKKGMLNYIIKEGILGWGLFTGIIFFIIDILLNFSQISLRNIMFSAIFSIGFFTIVGAFLSIIMWFILKNKLKE